MQKTHLIHDDSYCSQHSYHLHDNYYMRKSIRRLFPKSEEGEQNNYCVLIVYHQMYVMSKPRLYIMETFGGRILLNIVESL